MKNKVTVLASALLLSSAALSGTALANTMTSSSTTTATTQMTQAMQQRDGSIISTLMAINNNEINAGNEAIKRTTNPAVKNFAQMMVTQHTANLQALQTLSQTLGVAPMNTKKSEYVQAQGQKQLNTLSTIPANQFDTTYVNDMVKGHEVALNVINNKLLPNVQNANLKAFLTSTKDAVSNHLQMAETLQKQLKS